MACSGTALLYFLGVMSVFFNWSVAVVDLISWPMLCVWECHGSFRIWSTLDVVNVTFICCCCCCCCMRNDSKMGESDKDMNYHSLSARELSAGSLLVDTSCFIMFNISRHVHWQLMVVRTCTPVHHNAWFSGATPCGARHFVKHSGYPLQYTGH
jgi:hypothetical protein